eukprot:jgi/Astpho2/1644/e_gw1.00032.82.1_t
MSTKPAPGVSATARDTHVKLNSGNKMPLLGLGTSQAQGDECETAVKKAIDLGYRHIDTAEQYGNEHRIGGALSTMLGAGRVKREELWVTTKLWSNNHAAANVKKAAKASLAKLKLDHLDLYLIHWPYTGKPGPRIDPPLEETWQAMEGLVEEGLVRSIGISNFSPSKTQAVLKVAKIKPDVNQVEVHPHFRNERLRQWCTEQNIHVTAYGPLSSPGTMLSMGKSLPNLMRVKGIAHKNSKTPSQVLLRWGLQTGVSVMPKSTDARHMQYNLGALGWQLPPDDMAQLSSIGKQIKYFDGEGFISPHGPFRHYEELWDEQRPHAE